MIEEAKQVAQRLRESVQKLRRTPMPIADVSPLQAEAADVIEVLIAEGLRLLDNHERLKKMVDDGSINGRMYSAGLESEKEIDSLHAENERLREALKEITVTAAGSPVRTYQRMEDIARAALEERK